jgi:hypothetical protein
VGSSGIDLGPFIQALHIAFAAGVVASLIGALVSWGRGPEDRGPAEAAVGPTVVDTGAGASA